MNRILLIGIGWLLALNAGWTQGYWEEVEGPYGGNFQLTKTSSGILYANNISYASPEHILYHSDDDGVNWQELPPLQLSTPKWYTIGLSGNFYSRTSDYWRKSSDEGQTWQLLGSSSDSIDWLLEISDSVFVGYSGSYLLRSDDAGQTWVITSNYPLLDQRLLQNLKVMPGGNLLASVQVLTTDSMRTLYSSVDNGQSWQRISVKKSENFSSIYVTPTGTVLASKATFSGPCYRSVDYGESFSLVDSILIKDLTVLVSGRLLAISFYGLYYYSDNDGLTWKEFSSNYDNWEFQQIESLNDGSIFTNILNALYKSSDGGVTWHFSATGMRHAGW